MALLKERALNALRWARRAHEEGDHDTAVREAEYAAQLYTKAVIYRLSGEERRGHDIRALLGYLAAILIEEGFDEPAHRIMEFTRRHRRLLAELEEAHTRATYSPFKYGEREARAIIDAAEKVIELLKSVEKEVLGNG